MAPEERRANPVRAARNRFGLRESLIVGLLLCVTPVVAWKFSASPQAARPDRHELDKALLVAIRDGDHSKVQGQLDQGAYVNARDDAGETALMQAALNADTEMMRLLLQRGADPNARSLDGLTALVRAVHDPDKVKLLLDHGARVESPAVVLAATVPGCGRTLGLLLGRRGDVHANVGGFTALTAAAVSGDLKSVTFLLERGADVRARTPAGYTALNGAVLSGNADIVELLLDKSADPNARNELPNSNGDFQTPVIVAALQGHVDCLQRLLARGADVNVQGGPFERTALLGAATTGREEVVRLLLAKGADVKAEDWEGKTALDWAVRSGETRIVKLLREAGAKESSPPRQGQPRPRLHQEIDAGSVRRAVAASLPLLQRSGPRITERKGCVTCHQHALLAMTVGLARQHGFAVDEAIASQERAHVQAHLGGGISQLLLGSDIDATVAPYTLVGLAAEDQKPNRLTDALGHYLVLRQKQDGRWKTEVYRPPEDASDFMFTALAVRGLQVYAPQGRKKEIEGRIARARSWLLSAKPAETVDKVFHLLGLRWAHGEEESIQQAVQLVLGEQRADGGWAQLPTLPSDAYATGQVLFALHEAGGVSVDAPAYRRGVEFLLRTQLADGSWFVRTRSFPVVEYVNSGFPHGKSQFISAAATCWATMALTLTVPRPRGH